MDPSALARFLDHTLLRPDASADQLRALCDEAREHGFAAVCVNGAHVRLCVERLAGATPVVACTVGFPLGAMSPAAKAFEARRAVEDGAGELDVVVRVDALLAADESSFLDDLAGVVAAAGDAPVKAILETGLLDDEAKRRGARLVRAAGCAFVKTSTGFGPSGATVADVALLREVVGPEVGVKAAGGIRTREQAEALLAAGATRIGSSSCVAMVRD